VGRGWVGGTPKARVLTLDAHDAEQELNTALELQHPCAECLFILAKELRGDHRSGATANPARRRGAWNAQLGEEGVLRSSQTRSRMRWS